MNMRYVKTEAYKMWKNPWLWLSLCISTLFVLMSTVYVYRLYNSEMGVGGMARSLHSQGIQCKDELLACQNLWNSWIGSDGQSLGSVLFFMMTPLLAAMPIAIPFYREVHSGYLHTVVPKCGRHTYYRTKMQVAFVSGGCMLVIPQLLSLLLTALYIPAVRPDVVYDMYTPIFHGDMLAKLLYGCPAAYIGFILCINFMFGGWFALMSMAVSVFASYAVSALLIPYVIILLADAAKVFLLYINYTEISPLNILHPMTAPNYMKGWVILVWSMVLGGISVLIIIRGGEKNEIL